MAEVTTAMYHSRNIRNTIHRILHHPIKLVKLLNSFFLLYMYVCCSVQSIIYRLCVCIKHKSGELLLRHIQYFKWWCLISPPGCYKTHLNLKQSREFHLNLICILFMIRKEKAYKLLKVTLPLF